MSDLMHFLLTNFLLMRTSDACRILLKGEQKNSKVLISSVRKNFMVKASQIILDPQKQKISSDLDWKISLEFRSPSR